MNTSDFFGRTVVSTDGSKIGSVSNVFVDEGTDTREWVTVRTGLFGSHESFVPVAGSAVVGDTSGVDSVDLTDHEAASRSQL